jgi:hypothetical protein
MARLLMVAMTAVLLGCGSAFAQVGGMGITPGPSSLGMMSALGIDPSSAAPASSAGTSSSILSLLFDYGSTDGTASGTCAEAAGSSLAGPAASASLPTGMGSMTSGGRIGLPLSSTEQRNAPMIALTDKRTPADIQAVLAHVTAFGTCILVNSHERPPAVGGRSACVHSCDGKIPTIDKLNLSRCDVMFFDLNGGGATAIKGATATIKRFAPVIITTLSAEAAGHIIDALQALDYRLVDKVGGDYVYMKGEPI